LERETIESEMPVRSLRATKQIEVYQQEIEMRRLESQLRELVVQGDMSTERAKHSLHKELVLLQQTPKIAEAVSHLFQGANLSIYGETSPLLTTLIPLVDWLVKAVQYSQTSVDTQAS